MTPITVMANRNRRHIGLTLLGVAAIVGWIVTSHGDPGAESRLETQRIRRLHDRHATATSAPRSTSRCAIRRGLLSTCIDRRTRVRWPPRSCP